MITGISHITFIVKDLERSADFFKSIFAAEELYSSDNKNFSLSKEKFFLINNIWIAIMEGDSLRERTYNHIAFKVDSDDFDSYVQKIKELGVDIKEPRSRIKGEAESVYFYDYDNHLFEIHTGELQDRLNEYKQVERL